MLEKTDLSECLQTETVGKKIGSQCARQLMNKSIMLFSQICVMFVISVSF